MTDKIGIVIPTCSPERKPLLDFVISRIKKQTMPVHHIAVVDFEKKSGAPDLTKRYKIGIQECIEKGCNFILFFEDDDYYPVTYVKSMYDAWISNNKPQVIGCSETIYYHIFSKGYLTINTKNHASAHGTGVSKEVNLSQCRDTNVYFDIELWKTNKTKKLVYFKDHCISIKHNIGLCGGGGHCSTKYPKQDDGFYSYLNTIVDNEAFNFYVNFVNEYNEYLSMERQKNPLCPEYYNAIYKNSAEYSKTDITKSIYFPVWRNVLKFIDKNDEILELGCGNGLLARYLIANGYIYCNGIDFSEVAVDMAKKNNPNSERKFAVKDIRTISRIPKHLTVLSLETFEHLEDEISLLQIIDKDTRIVFSVPDFTCEAHQRYFVDSNAIYKRYGEYIAITEISKIRIADGKYIYLIGGTKK